MGTHPTTAETAEPRRPDAAPAERAALRLSRALLTVEDIHRGFRHGVWPLRSSVPVLRGASLEVRGGELVGLVGENGSGKSTLLRIVVGLLRADAGSVSHTGRLGYCPQEPLLWEKLTVAEHFALYGRAYGLSAAEGSRSVERLLRLLDFSRYVGFRVDELSGGTRQKLNLALALMHDPAILVLDEPYAGFDWETYLAFWTLAAEERARGKGFLVVSHLLPERARLDRVYRLAEGARTEQ